MMAWTRLLWGVESCGRVGEKPFLIGSAWVIPRPMSQYKGEPTRALLFMTRQQARDWCRAQMASYAGRGDVCSLWRFKAVRVRESVVKG